MGQASCVIRCATSLHLRDAKVAILDINFQAAEQLAGEIKQTGGEALGMSCDVCDKESILSAAQQVAAHGVGWTFLLMEQVEIVKWQLRELIYLFLIYQKMR